MLIITCCDCCVWACCCCCCDCWFCNCWFWASCWVWFSVIYAIYKSKSNDITKSKTKTINKTNHDNLKPHYTKSQLITFQFSCFYFWFKVNSCQARAINSNFLWEFRIDRTDIIMRFFFFFLEWMAFTRMQFALITRIIISFADDRMNMQFAKQAKSWGGGVVKRVGRHSNVKSILFHPTKSDQLC